MSALGIHVKCDSDSIAIRKLGIEDVPVVLASNGHYLMDITEFRSAPKVRELWKAGVAPKIELDSGELEVYDAQDFSGVKSVCVADSSASASSMCQVCPTTFKV